MEVKSFFNQIVQSGCSSIINAITVRLFLNPISYKRVNAILPTVSENVDNSKSNGGTYQLQGPHSN